MPYPKNVEELKENAVIYWPSEIAEKERNSSIIPLLLATQDHFISVLHLADKDPLCLDSIFVSYGCALSESIPKAPLYFIRYRWRKLKTLCNRASEGIPKRKFPIYLSR